MKYLLLSLLAILGLSGCGKEEATQSSDAQMFSVWSTTEEFAGDDAMTIDMSRGQEDGIFDIVVYRSYQGNLYHCDATVHYSNGAAKVLDWTQSRAFVGADCRSILQDTATGKAKTLALAIDKSVLRVREMKSVPVSFELQK
jgi:hypothetical protein